MTIERFNDDYYDFDTKLAWLLGRMRLFHNTARRYAILADKLWDDFIDTSLKNRGGIKYEYDKAILAQEMYDRWAMREAQVIQAEVSAQTYRKRYFCNSVIDRFEQSEFSDNKANRKSD